jgi:ubiquinone/menaquinone biosynthesis C-methylase UbiE
VTVLIAESKLQFWNTRAAIGRNAGSNDFILKQLEQQQILAQIPENSRVLDIGCGNGETLIRLATEKACEGTGIDFSPEMLKSAASTARETGCAERTEFREACLPELPQDLEQYDYAVSERCLINLADHNEQQAAFRNIMHCLKPGGRYLMVESFKQGLERSNELRQCLDLEPIDPPWHNCFIDEEIAASWADENFVLEETLPFTSTYHFLSRVIYARLGATAGEELQYDSEINQLALKLPAIGDLGPVRMWTWRRTR